MWPDICNCGQYVAGKGRENIVFKEGTARRWPLLGGSLRFSRVSKLITPAEWLQRMLVTIAETSSQSKCGIMAPSFVGPSSEKHYL